MKRKVLAVVLGVVVAVVAIIATIFVTSRLGSSFVATPAVE